MSSNALPIRIRDEASQQLWSDEAIALQQPWSDEAIARGCGCGDPRAVAELFDRFRSPVTRFLSRLVAHDEIEDLVQSVFLQIARGKSRYDGRSSARTWVFAIAANVARQHYRKSRLRRKSLWTWAALNTTPCDERLAGQVEARSRFKSACEAFDSMSENARLAFVLCEVDGVRAREAGRILETSEAAIWKRVSDVRKTLLRAAEGLPRNARDA